MSDNHLALSVTPSIQQLLVELKESCVDQRHNDFIIMQTVTVTAAVLEIVYCCRQQ